MAFEHRRGSFSLFKNDKGDNENRPDYTGDGLDPEGKPIKVSAWIKQGKNGKFMSCSIQYKTRGEPSQMQERGPRNPVADIESDIPF